jgi:predicted transcriptional regulator
MKMAENLKELLQKFGIKQCAVAKEAKMDAGKLSKIERGWINPKPSEVARIKAAIKKLGAEGN